jgi:hypothetical protein
MVEDQHRPARKQDAENNANQFLRKSAHKEATSAYQAARCRGCVKSRFKAAGRGGETATLGKQCRAWLANR